MFQLLLSAGDACHKVQSAVQPPAHFTRDVCVLLTQTQGHRYETHRVLCEGLAHRQRSDTFASAREEHKERSPCLCEVRGSAHPAGATSVVPFRVSSLVTCLTDHPSKDAPPVQTGPGTDAQPLGRTVPQSGRQSHTFSETLGRECDAGRCGRAAVLAVP